MRDYYHVESYLNELLSDVYEQPNDDWHTAQAKEVINAWVSKLHECKTVLDVGCGNGFCQDEFEKFGICYLGATLGKDYVEAKKLNRKVENYDFSFLPIPDNNIDLVFSRHSLEHSPIPLLTLMEWHRVAKNWLCLILPKPSYWKFGGRNHYFVLTLNQVKFLLERAGWHIIWEDVDGEYEYRLMCEKVNRIKYESGIDYDEVEFHKP
jgi:SAM-dependent methyltransferase